MKKIGILIGMSVLSVALLTGCTSSADTMPSPSPAATTTPSNSPKATAPANTMEATQGPSMSIMPSATDNAGMQPSAGVNTVEDAKRVSERVSEEVEKLSELDNAQAVVAGNIALVGIEYDSQYQGGLTDRLIGMVEERVDMVDKTITTVHVTDDPQKMKQIAELQDKLDETGMTFETLQTKVLDIGSSIAGGGEPEVNQPQSTAGA